MNISATKPPNKGIVNSCDHFANFFMQDTIATMNVTIVCYKTIVCYNNIVAIWLAIVYSGMGRARFALINYYDCHYKVVK